MTADFARLGEQVRDACAAGVDRIHLDVMDGHFVPNISFGPLVAKSIRPHCPIPLEAHLMIENADRYLEPFVAAGVDLIIVHVEACHRLEETIRAVRAFGKKVGVTLNPGTPLSSIEPVLAAVDLLLVMTVQPGFGGQAFLPGMLDKIREARALVDRVHPACELEVDGGINLDTIHDAHHAGAEVFVVGSAVYNHRASVGDNVRQLNAALASK
jgi:ribulose-phosphate 3-epimerase